MVVPLEDCCNVQAVLRLFLLWLKYPLSRAITIRVMFIHGGALLQKMNSTSGAYDSAFMGALVVCMHQAARQALAGLSRDIDFGPHFIAKFVVRLQRRYMVSTSRRTLNWNRRAWKVGTPPCSFSLMSSLVDT